MGDNLTFSSDEQKKEFMEQINPDNCGEKLVLVRTSLNMTKRDLAKTIGCSESTVSRIEAKKTKPTPDFMNRLLGLVFIGHSKYSSMSEKEKANLSEYIGAAGGIFSGVGGAIGAVSAAGSVAGLSAAGITSGLSAIGGSMVGGVAAIASIPVAAGLAGFGIVKGIKAICDANQLNCEEVDGRFEIIKRKNNS